MNEIYKNIWLSNSIASEVQPKFQSVHHLEISGGLL